MLPQCKHAVSVCANFADLHVADTVLRELVRERTLRLAHTHTHLCNAPSDLTDLFVDCDSPKAKMFSHIGVQHKQRLLLHQTLGGSRKALRSSVNLTCHRFVGRIRKSAPAPMLHVYPLAPGPRAQRDSDTSKQTSRN